MPFARFESSVFIGNDFMGVQADNLACSICLIEQGLPFLGPFRHPIPLFHSKAVSKERRVDLQVVHNRVESSLYGSYIHDSILLIKRPDRKFQIFLKAVQQQWGM